MINYAELDDNVLQAKVTEGDRLAEEQLAMRYARLVRICSRPLFLAGGDSEDLIQEGMFGLLSAIRQYDPQMSASFKTYAELCIRRRLLSAIKSASRNKHIPLNDGISLDSLLSEETQIPLSAYTELFRRTPEEQVLARENREELYLSFERCLSKLERSVLQLYLDGLSYADIAKELGRDEKAIDNAVQRIRRKLAQNLNPGEISIS